MWTVYLWVCVVIAVYVIGGGIIRDISEYFDTSDLDDDYGQTEDEPYYNVTDPFFWMFGFLVSFPVVNLIVVGLTVLAIVFRPKTV